MVALPVAALDVEAVDDERGEVERERELQPAAHHGDGDRPARPGRHARAGGAPASRGRGHDPQVAVDPRVGRGSRR